MNSDFHMLTLRLQATLIFRLGISSIKQISKIYSNTSENS